MRIAFFVHWFPVVSEAFISNAAAGLIDAGHEVDIYALDGAGPPEHGRHGIVDDYKLEKRAKILRNKWRPKRRIFDLPKAFLKVFSAHGFKAFNVFKTSYFGDDARSLIALHEAALFAGMGKYDVLHCQFATLAETVMRHRDAGLLSGDIFVHFRGYDISNVIQERGETVYNEMLAKADGFGADCDFFKDRAVKLGADEKRFSTFPCGVAVKEFKFIERRWEPGQPLNMLFVGRMVEKKGLKYAIEGIAEVVNEGVDIRFVILGGGPLEQELKALAQNLGILDRIEFAGPAPHDRIALELDRAHLFIGPSTTASNGDQDGPINTVKEAMISGCPFITTNHGGIPELVAGVDAGEMVEEASGPAIAGAIRRLIERRSEWGEMGETGRQYILDHHSIKAATVGTVAAYNKMKSIKTADKASDKERVKA